MDYERLKRLVDTTTHGELYEQLTAQGDLYQEQPEILRSLFALLDERDRLAAEVVALREALRAVAPNGHTADCIITTSFGGGQVGPCTTDCVEVAQALADPSPAVAEVLRLVELGRKAQDA